VSDDDIAEHIRYKHEQEKVRARYTGWVCVLVCGALNFVVWRLHAERPRADQEGEAGSKE
jgi:IS5 family transposase